MIQRGGQNRHRWCISGNVLELVFYILVQQFENVFVVPRVLGGAVDLHPMVVMIGVLVGASVAGIFGALLAAPVIASGIEIIRYLYQKVLGEDPYPSGLPEHPEPPPPILDQLKLIASKFRRRLARLRHSSLSDTQEAPSQKPREN